MVSKRDLMKNQVKKQIIIQKEKIKFAKIKLKIEDFIKKKSTKKKDVEGLFFEIDEIIRSLRHEYQDMLLPKLDNIHREMNWARYNKTNYPLIPYFHELLCVVKEMGVENKDLILARMELDEVKI